jgi:hypothetical protein
MNPPNAENEYGFRDGHQLVLIHGCTSPHRCILCNGPAARTIWYRFDDRRAPGVVHGLVADAINSIRGRNYTGPVDVQIHFCDWHLKIRRWFLIACILVFLVGAGLLPYAKKYHPGNNDFFIMIPTLLMILGGGVAFGLVTKMFTIWSITAKRFEDRIVWINGAGKSFLSSLPALGSSQPENHAGTN